MSMCKLCKVADPTGFLHMPCCPDERPAELVRVSLVAAAMRVWGVEINRITPLRFEYFRQPKKADPVSRSASC